MKLLLKILFAILAIFQTNISEAKVFVFEATFSEIKFTFDNVESKNDSKLILENDFATTCKSESKLVDFRNWGTSVEVVAAKTSPKLLNPAINITEKGLAHTLERHTVNGIAKWANKSKFFNASEVESLIQQGTQMPMVSQANGNFSRVVNAGRNIGIDRAPGNPTSIYTIITNGQGNLITAFPGIP